MFDLDREVANWTTTVHANRCQSDAGEAELSDHLYCEIERGRADGLSAEQAFHAATARLGSATQLVTEHEKNRSTLGAVCKLAVKLDGGFRSSRYRSVMLTHGMIWAALMISSALILRSEAPKASPLLLTMVIIPLWCSSELLLRRVLRERMPRA
jgi:hypothetical protein